MTFPATAAGLIERLTSDAETQADQAIAFQGAPGGNGYIAAVGMMPDRPPLPCFSFEDVVDAVKEDKARWGIIPIENSVHGRVADIHFLLPESGLFIVGEYFLEIRHCLIGRGSLEEVREAASHPQALGQCRKWLRARSIAPIPAANTATAVAELAAAGAPLGKAAIGPELAAELYDLPVLARDIADERSNVTRFVLLAREPLEGKVAARCMTTLLFEVRNVPAALFKALGGFATNGVNMTKLESYQRGDAFRATEFYADIEGHPDDPAVARALEELAFYSKWVRTIGTYPQAMSRSEEG